MPTKIIAANAFCKGVARGPDSGLVLVMRKPGIPTMVANAIKPISGPSKNPSTLYAIPLGYPATSPTTAEPTTDKMRQTSSRVTISLALSGGINLP